MGKEELYIAVPSYFRCPISLDVMKSPVSLCTGVTYDRTSIQRWLDGGHNTCPATMQILPTKEFVPNHTLHRLIQIWSSHSRADGSGSESRSESGSRFFYSLSPSQAASLVDDLSSSSPEDDLHVDRFLKLLCFACESVENRRFLSRNDAFVEMLVRKMTRFGDHRRGMENKLDFDLVEAAVKILQQIARSYDAVDGQGKSKLRTVFLRPDTLASVGPILRIGRRESRIAIADIIETLASSDSEFKLAVLDNEEILTELVRGLNRNQDPNSSGADLTEAFLSCMLCLSTPKRNKQRLVRAGTVREVGKLLRRRETGAGATEVAMKLLEVMLGCSEGRKAMCEDRECVAAVVGRLLIRGSGAACESGVAVLWSVCYWLRDQRAREAVAAANGLTRILLVMQSGCSPAAKRMCGDLLRIFRVNAKSCLGSYDTKTIHIMPF